MGCSTSKPQENPIVPAATSGEDNGNKKSAPIVEKGAAVGEYIRCYSLLLFLYLWAFVWLVVASDLFILSTLFVEIVVALLFGLHSS